MSTFISDVKNPKPAASTAVTALPIPAFGDLGKAANDLISKDFYHASQGSQTAAPDPICPRCSLARLEFWFG